MTTGASHDLQASPPPLRVLVASGPTREPIDDVRFIGNRSSGRMGAAIADAFRHAGCQVTVALGPGAERPAGVEILPFGTAAELLRLLRQQWPSHDLLIMAAAVADFTPSTVAQGKMSRQSGAVRLDLQPTQDILASLASHTRSNQYVVGFALERAETLENSARQKLHAKRADAIVANSLDAMDAATVQGKVLMSDGIWRAPPEGASISKQLFASWLCGLILPLARIRVQAT
jgi:phosphopantothenoylcysteine decarboxylase/phosphopantothenate--cysteine ligase